MHQNIRDNVHIGNDHNKYIKEIKEMYQSIYYPIDFQLKIILINIVSQHDSYNPTCYIIDLSPKLVHQYLLTLKQHNLKRKNVLETKSRKEA